MWFFYKRYNIALVVVIVLICSECLCLFMSRDLSVATFYMPVTRFWELLIGSLLASKNFNKSTLFDLKQNYSNFLSILGVVFTFLGLCIINSDFVYPSYWAWLPTLGAACFISAGPNAWINRNILSSKPFVFFGLISFPLYLWHWPMVAFRNILKLNITITEDRLFKVLIVILSILLSYITYKWIELPIRSSSKK